MKKLFGGLLVIAMVFCFVSCGGQEQGTALKNPMTNCGSLEELNQSAGTDLKLPEDMTVTDENFATIQGEGDLIAQYSFTSNGYSYTLRCAPAVFDDDISGVYIDAKPAFEGALQEEFEMNSDKEVKVARWLNINGQFSLSVEDCGKMTDEEFETVVQCFMEYSNPALTGKRLEAYFEKLSGTWMDRTSQRAVLEVTPLKDSAKFLVSWANSASETVVWEMTVKLSEDGLLYYDDCKKEIQIWNEAGEESVEILSTGGVGFFSLGAEDGILYWNGAEEADCAKCAFEKVPN